MADYDSLPDTELLSVWNSTLDMKERDRIIEVMKERNLFPSTAMTEWEAETGAYPLFEDPQFLQKLLAKREFAESLQTTWKPEDDPCGDQTRFEITPVQRFVTNLMSPRSPYMSALLYHGVGVGKTCAAVQITEAWLETFPHEKVIIVAPPTIQQGFIKTIFNSSETNLVISKEVDAPNHAIGCTGDTYLKLTGTLLEKDRDVIQRRVNSAIRRRYAIYGYNQFANRIRDLVKDIPATATKERRDMLESNILRTYFSGKLLVIDEAHNLRDLPDELSEEMATDEKLEEGEEEPGGKTQKTDSAGGKLLTPYLRKVLKYAEGMKLVLLTATPMYNSYLEIIFILNLLLLNDKKAPLVVSDIFNEKGALRPGAEEKLGAVAQHYVSFMRGENPMSFPVRLMPEDVPKLSLAEYPSLNPRGVPVPPEEKIFIDKLPIVAIPLKGDALKASMAYTNDLPPGKGDLSSIRIHKLVQSGNCIVPVTDSTRGDTIKEYRKRLDIDGLRSIFTEEMIKSEKRIKDRRSGLEKTISMNVGVRFRAKQEDGARWLGADQLSNYAPKISYIVNRLRKTEGVAFVYSRFIASGALPMALALEANGYTLYGRKFNMLSNGIQYQPELGRQCALCELREKQHTMNMDHEFAPAYYGILTGDDKFSVNNEETIQGERLIENKNGVIMKVIIGSQIASEGVDLKFIREIHVVDSWFHLNRTEQVLGRGIRFCSHSALPKEKRNTTIYLYATTLPAEVDRETADLYSYRIAFRKAVQVGRISRIMKTYAIDCNLNHDAIIISGQAPITQIDAQGKVRRDRVSINDMPFTAVCDWTECAYDCKPQIKVDPLGTDDSTYSEFAARWRENKLKQRVRELFALQPNYKSDDFWDMIDAPRVAVIDLLTSIINNKMFQVQYNNITGYVRYCNGYYVFQPNVYGDLAIPLSIRVARIPFKRDFFTPVIKDYVEEVDAALEDEKEDAIDDEELVHFWKSLVTWCTALATSKDAVKVPKPVLEHIRRMSNNMPDIQRIYSENLDMVYWFQVAYHKSSNKDNEKMRNALLQYFWDNWLTLNEQKLLTYSADIPGANTMINEFRINVGSSTVTRFLNPENGEIIYWCNTNKQCDKSIVDEVLGMTDEEDYIQHFTIDNRTTGKLYGFLTPKNGKLVFKTNEPPKVDTKAAKARAPGRGLECISNSTISAHIKDLKELGTILEEHDMTDFDLNDVEMTSRRKFAKSSRACTLKELILRYMDKKHIARKRWFFRPVSAKYAGHEGLFKVGKTSKVIEKTISKKEGKVTKRKKGAKADEFE